MICLALGMFSISAISQQTYVYKDPLLLYKQGKEYYQLENFPLAQNTLGKSLEIANDNRDDNHDFNQLLQMDAAYHYAVCAKHLDKEDADYLLSQFIYKYHNNRRYNSLANYQLGELFYTSRNYRGALSCFEEIFEDDLDPADYEHYKFIQAFSHFNLKQFSEAKGYFANVVRVKGKHYVDASYYLGYLAFEDQDFDTAVENFLVIEKNDRYKNIIPYYITQIYYKQGNGDKILSYAIPKLQDRKIKYKTQMNKIVGQTYYDRRQFAEALPYLKYYVEYSNKVSKEDLYLLGFTQYQFGKYEDAIENFLELNTLTDQFGQNAMYHLADCYLKISDKDKARTAFKQAASMDSDPEITRISAFNFAKLSYELGIQSEALDAILAFIDQYPGQKETDQAKNILGEILEQTNNYSQAIKIIEGIPSKNTRLKKAYQKICYAKAIDFYGNNQNDQAILHFEKSLTYPNDQQLVSLTNFWKGNLYYNKGNYGQAEKELKKYLANPAAKNESVSPGIANYTIAYGYYTQKEYSKAEPYFAKAISNLKSKKADEKFYSDALLRSGDCNFIKRSYSKAQSDYDKVINANMDGSDYAIFQSGMIAGLQQNYSQKISFMEKLCKKFPDSYYGDDALYQISNTHSLQQNYNASISTLQQLIEKYPDGTFYKQSLVDLGVMYYNIDSYDSAITYYDRVIREFPNSPEANQAVFNLKEVFIAKGDSDGYFDYIQSSPDIEITTSGQDTIMYQFAENFYSTGDCQSAILEFNKYLTNHPRGAYNIYAHFYRGDCLYQQKSYKQARSDFDYIVKQKNNLFTEKSLLRGARIAFVVDKNDEKAFQYYKQLLSIASQPEITTEALKGLTKSAYSLGNDAAVEKYGSKLLQDRRASKNDKLEANFFLARISYKKGKLDDAKVTYQTVAKQSNSEVGAEARYLIADILYQQNKLNEASEACFRVDRETPEQEYWVVKSFILLSDVYSKKGEAYQAKQTLKSIVDNYVGDQELMEDAKRKLDKILAEEKANSKLEDQDGSSEELELDEDN